MEIVTYLNGIVSRHINADEFLPLGNASYWIYVQAIADRYDFKAVGQAGQLGTSGGDDPVFQNGSFVLDGQLIPIMEVRIFTNRILVNCSKTDQAQAFHQDLRVFLESNHGFRDSRRDPHTSYASAMVIKPEDEIIDKVQIITEMGKIVSESFSEVGQEGTLYPQAIRFSGVTKFGDGGQNSTFLIEERAGRPNGSNWLYTQASLPTAVHASTLEKLEDLVRGYRPHTP